MHPLANYIRGTAAGLPNSLGSRPFAWSSVPNDSARRVRSYRAISGRRMRLRFCLAVLTHPVSESCHVREMPNSRGSRPFARNSVPNDAACRVRSYRTISGRCMRLRFCLAVRAHAPSHVTCCWQCRTLAIAPGARPAKRYNIFREPSLRAPGRPASTWRRSARSNTRA